MQQKAEQQKTQSRLGWGCLQDTCAVPAFGTCSTALAWQQQATIVIYVSSDLMLLLSSAQPAFQWHGGS